MNNYDDIINLNRPISKHQHLGIDSRSAQFAPFAALVGYDEAVKETARLTDKRIEIDEGLKEMINSKLNYLNEHIKDNNEVIITYFIQDKKKNGGKYINKIGIIKKSAYTIYPLVSSSFITKCPQKGIIPKHKTKKANFAIPLG